MRFLNKIREVLSSGKREVSEDNNIELSDKAVAGLSVNGDYRYYRYREEHIENRLEELPENVFEEIFAEMLERLKKNWIIEEHKNDTSDVSSPKGVIYEILEAIYDSNKGFHFDRECIYNFEEDYRRVFEMFQENSDGIMEDWSFKAVGEREDDDKYIEIEVNGDTYRASIKSKSDWYDSKLTRLVNDALDDHGEGKYFFYPEQDDFYGQNGICLYLTPAQADSLMTMIKSPEFLDFSGENKKIGYRAGKMNDMVESYFGP